ncbi:SUKH-3 domain-containing protein [Streptomyces sp. ODS28]|uniref:SUKH-3 domain-containing protein n=1 Tax=Streptomyces sp. ODS28 TaxID=3136688 RepID=UPI0031F086B5
MNGQSAQRWSAETEGVLRRAGWYPGRSVSTHEWETALQQSGFEINEAARRFLAEFGGIESTERGPGQTMARVGFKLDPTVAQWDREDIFDFLNEEAGTDLYPVGEVDRGNDHLAVAANGAVYAGMDSVVLLAESAEEALEKLALGIR